MQAAYPKEVYKWAIHSVLAVCICVRYLSFVVSGLAIVNLTGMVLVHTGNSFREKEGQTGSGTRPVTP